MNRFKTRPDWSFLRTISRLILIACLSSGFLSLAEEPFVEEFDGPELDESWMIFDKEGDTHKGFTGKGEYEIVDSQSTADAGLGRALSGTGDFTADVSLRLQDFFEGRADFKFRFLAPKFMELVFNSNDLIRVYSGERGGNAVSLPAFGYPGDAPMHIRFSWTESSGTMRVGVAIEEDPLQLITTIDGLTGFQPTRVDLVLFRIGPGDHSPRLFLDRFEILDEALPVGIPAFSDDFSGPDLGEGWSPLDNEDGATQIGFADGRYEIKDNQKGGDAGVRRPVGGTGSFTATARLTLQDFAGSNSDFKFRFLGGKFIEVVYNSFDDIRVFSGEVGGNIGRFNKVGFQDGDVLDFKMAFDSVTGTVQVGFAQNGGPMILLAEESSLFGFEPKNVDLMLFKFGDGNGNAPRLLLDQFELNSGYLPLAVEPFTDDFDGPALAAAWNPVGNEAGQAGFLDGGHYEIKGGEGDESNGLRLRLPAPGSVTVDLKAKLTGFSGSDADFRLRLPGPGDTQLAFGGDGSLRVFSQEKGGEILKLDDFNLGNDEPLDVRIAWNADSLALEMGVAKNGEDLELIVSEFDVSSFDPRSLEILLSNSGETSLMLDKIAVRQGFAAVPVERIEPFVDEFDGPDLSLDWAELDDVAQIGFSDGLYQFSDPSRSAGVAGIQTPIIGGGSFTVDADIIFDEFLGTGSDFKIRLFGGAFIELVYNSFDDIRVHSGEKGPINRINKVGITHGVPVHFRFIWNEAIGTAQYGMMINDGPWTIIGTATGLTDFTPNSVDMVMFKFGDGPVPLVSIDRFELRPGVFEMPTTPPVQPFQDSFDGPDLAEGWSLIDDSTDAQVGFSDGRYQVQDPSTSAGAAGIQRKLVGMGGSFTADLAVRLDQFSGSNSDFKFRFLGGRFLEIVYNSFDDLRVFSQERGENVARLQGVGIQDGDDLQLRLIWDDSAKEAVVGLAVGSDPMMEIARVADLKEFGPATVDFILFKFGEGNGNTPAMTIDSFEITSAVVPIPEVLPPVEAFADTFDGPELGEGWTLRDETPEAQIGFNDLGAYQVNEPSTSSGGDAGIRRALPGGGSFTADLELQFQDFSGSNSDFKFRFFGGKFIELVYNSFDDIRVFSAEKGGNVNRINKVGITDGVPLHFRFTWDAEGGTATFTLSIDGGAMQEIASADGLTAFSPDTVDFVMFKFGEGNGNTPKMLIDRFEIQPGIAPPPGAGMLAPVEITGIDLSGDAALTATITWTSAPGESYNLEWSENLIDWSELASGIASAGDETSASEMEIPQEVSHRFYRVLRSNP